MTGRLTLISATALGFAVGALAGNRPRLAPDLLAIVGTAGVALLLAAAVQHTRGGRTA